MKHVCIDSRLLEASGIGTFLKSLLKYFSNYFELTLLHKEEDKEKIASFSPKKAIILKSPIYSLKEHIELSRKIPICDLFFSPHFNVPLLPIRAKRRLTTIHDALPYFYLSGIKRMYARFLFKRAFSLSNCVVTDSIFSSSELKKAGLKQLKVIPLGIDPTPYQLTYSHEEIAELKKRYLLPPSFILYVGNVKPHKNLATLLKAYAQVFPEEHLVIVGRKEGFLTGDKALFHIIKDKNLEEKIHFTGVVSDKDLPLFYQLATLFVFPSFYEGFGYPPLEAMASKCPVMASSAASLPEVCQDGAEYIDPHNVASLVKSLKKLLESKHRREELIEKGSKVIETYQERKFVHSYIQLINEMVA